MADKTTTPKPQPDNILVKVDTMPILELTAVSKKGATPSDIAGSMAIQWQNNSSIIIPKHFTSAPVDIVEDANLGIVPKWHVWVSVNIDPHPYDKKDTDNNTNNFHNIRINALLSFYEGNYPTDKRHARRLASGDIDSGEWLLSIKVQEETKVNAVKPGDDEDIVLAYVKVKITDQSDTPTSSGTANKSQGAAGSEELAKSACLLPKPKPVC